MADPIQVKEGMANAMSHARRYEEAVNAYQEVIHLRREKNSSDPQIFFDLHAMGVCLRHLERYPEAVDAFKEAADGRRNALGPDDPQTKESEDNLGFVLNGLHEEADRQYSAGSFGQAADLYRRCAELRTRVLGEGHSDTMASWHGLGCALDQHGHFDAAVNAYFEALRLRTRHLGEHDNATRATMGNLCFSLDHAGRLEDCYKYRRRLLGTTDPETLKTLHRVGEDREAKGNRRGALRAFRRCFKRRRGTLGSGDGDTLASFDRMLRILDAMHGEAVALYQAEKFKQALETYKECLRAKKAGLGKPHESTLMTVQGIASTYDQLGVYDESVKWYQKVLKHQESPEPAYTTDDEED